MANSKYEYVKLYEREDRLLPECFIVVRIDGRGFHRLSKFYNFEKPNDIQALQLMNHAALGVLRNVQDIVVAYGDSDEYSFVFDRNTTIFERREAKLVSTVVSTFTSVYASAWPDFFGSPLKAEMLPTFDARAVLYPTKKAVRDYLSWRQVDCHINNLYNTTFWALVQKGKLTPKDAEQRLCGSVSADKNEILFSEFGINYNNEPDIYKKGSLLVWSNPPTEKGRAQGSLSERQRQRIDKKRLRTTIQVLHCDIVRSDWLDAVL